MAGASVESSRFVVLRSPRGRQGSLLDVGNRLRRMRGRRLPMSSSDPRRPRGDLRTTNRQDSIDAPALVASSISRIKKINFFAPQEVSH